MTKAEFMQALEGALVGATPDERVAALQYYNEYFDEAGPEREAAVAEELGSPLVIAADILGTPPPAGGARPTGEAKAAGGAAKQRQAAPSADEAGASFGMPPPPKAPPPPPPDPTRGGFGAGADDVQDVEYTSVETLPAPQQAPATRDDAVYDPRNMMVLKIVLLVLACIILIPLTGGITAAITGGAVATVVLFTVPLIAGVALAIGGVSSFVAGILIMGASPGSGLVALGLGVLILMLGLMSFYGGVKLFSKALPAIIRGIIWLVQRIIGFFKGLFGKPHRQDTEVNNG